MSEPEIVGPENIKPSFKADYRPRFRQARRLTGYSASALGRALGVSPQAVSQFEIGRQDMAVSVFLDVCQVLNANPGWVLTGEGAQFLGEPASASRGRPARRAPSGTAQPST